MSCQQSPYFDYEKQRIEESSPLKDVEIKGAAIEISCEGSPYSDYEEQRVEEDSLLKIRRWIRQLGLTIKILPITIFLIFGFMTETSYASFSCPVSQTGELGTRGTIKCSFPDTSQAIHWYDDVRPGSSPLISYNHQMEDKTEFCSENENYDVAEDGSLIICIVAVWHEKNYTVIVDEGNDHEDFTVFFKVIASPGSRSATIHCGSYHGGRYHRIHTEETLCCSFGGSRPPVSIEWVERYPQGDSLIATQKVQISNNTNGTYNTLADVQLVDSSDRPIFVLVCRATSYLSQWKSESELLIDASRDESFSHVPSRISYMEINKRAEIRCGRSDTITIIWKFFLPTGEPETIGFKLGNSTEMTKDITGIKISIEGNLIFSSPQIHHEGEYACVYSDGESEIYQKMAVVVLIPPSPPYIQITGCNDAHNTCVLKEEAIQNLTCSVDGIYPNATLEWISKHHSQISFENPTSVYGNIGQTFDISVSVQFLVSLDILCEEDIYIWCRLQGPTSLIMNNERKVQLIPEYCTSKNDDENIRWITWIFPVVSIFVLLGALSLCLISFFRHRQTQSMKQHDPVKTSGMGCYITVPANDSEENGNRPSIEH